MCAYWPIVVVNNHSCSVVLGKKAVAAIGCPSSSLLFKTDKATANDTFLSVQRLHCNSTQRIWHTSTPSGHSQGPERGPGLGSTSPQHCRSMHITTMATKAHNQPLPSLWCLLPWWVLAGSVWCWWVLAQGITVTTAATTETEKS